MFCFCSIIFNNKCEWMMTIFQFSKLFVYVYWSALKIMKSGWPLWFKEALNRRDVERRDKRRTLKRSSFFFILHLCNQTVWNIFPFISSSLLKTSLKIHEAAVKMIWQVNGFSSFHLLYVSHPFITVFITKIAGEVLLWIGFCWYHIFFLQF